MTVEVDHRRKILRNTIWLSSAPVLRLAIGFLVTVQVIRHLGPERFGIYSYILSVVSMLAPLASFGLEQIAIRQLVSEPHRHNEILGSVLAIRFSGAAVAFFITIGAIFALDGRGDGLLELGALAAASLLFVPFESFADLLKSHEKMAGVALPQAVGAIVIAIVTLWLISFDASLAWFVATRAGEAALLAVGFVAACTALIGRVPRPRPNMELIGTFLRQGWPILLSGFSVAIYMRIDQIMLAQLAAPEALGQYAAAVRFAELFFFVPMAIASAFYPNIVRAHGAGPKAFEVAVQHYSDAMVTVCYLLLAVLLVGGSIAIIPLLGERYSQSVPIFNVLAASIIFVGIGLVQGSTIIARGWLWTYPLVTLAGAIANVLLNILLIPRYGPMGAAWATVLSYWVSAQGMGFALPWLRTTALAATRSLNPVASLSRLLARRRQ